MTEALVLRSPVKGDFHAGFCSGAGAGDRPGDRNLAASAIIQLYII